MANEVRIDLVAKGATQTARDIDKVGDAADGTGDDFKGMAVDAKILDKAIDGLNDSLTETRLKLAAAHDDKTLWKQLRSQEREVNKLAKLRKMVFGDATDTDAKNIGVQVGKQVSSGLADALGVLPSQLRGVGIAAGVAVALAASPVIGGAIGAAIIGGVGVGGIAGGIAAAAQDPAVKAAGAHLGESLTDSFTGIGVPFIEPLIEQMGRLEGIGGAFFANLTDDIAPLAGHLDGLTDSIAAMARRADFGKIVKAAGPVIDVIGKELPEVVDAAMDAMESMAAQSDGLALSLGQVFDLFEEGVRGTGDLIAGLAAVNQAISDVNEATGDIGDTLMEEWPIFTTGLLQAIGRFGELGGETDGFTEKAIRARGSSEELGHELVGVGADAEKAAEEIAGLSDLMDKVFNRQMTLDEATATYKQGIRDLNKELTEGKRTLSENTQEGHDNAAAVRDQIQNIEDLREAQFNQTGNLKAANAVYEQHIAQLRTTLLNLGYNKAEVEALIAAYKRIPKVVETEIRIRETFKGGGGVGGETHPLEHRAGGGGTKGGRTYIVGENGPELWSEGADGHMFNAAQTQAMMSGASGGSSAGAAQEIRLVIDVRGDDEEQVRRIRKQVEVLGGGNVQVAFGRN